MVGLRTESENIFTCATRRSDPQIRKKYSDTQNAKRSSNTLAPAQVMRDLQRRKTAVLGAADLAAGLDAAAKAAGQPADAKMVQCVIEVRGMGGVAGTRRRKAVTHSST